MSELAINQIIVIANDEMRRARERLEVEESGRGVAALQGNLVGYKKLVGHMAAEFGLTEIFLEDLGDTPLKITEVDDETLLRLEMDIQTLPVDPAWLAVLRLISRDTEELKNYLLFTAEKSRDLYLKQGQWKGETVYTRLFESVEIESKRRQAERERKAKQPELSLVQ